MITVIDFKHFIEFGQHKITLPIGVEGFKIFIYNYWAVAIESVIPPEAIEVAIVVIHGVGIDLGTSVEMLVEGLPDELHRFVGESLLFVLEVKAGEEPRIKSHVGK